MSRPPIISIPHAELKHAATVEHNLEVSELDGVSAGIYLEYHANRYIHTGSHCREIANELRRLFPEARHVGYAVVGSTLLAQGNAHTDVLRYCVVQLE